MHFTPFETYPSGHTHVNPLQFAPCGHALQSTLLVDSSVYLFEYAHHNMEEVLMRFYISLPEQSLRVSHS